jgi:hypothetical protein
VQLILLAKQLSDTLLVDPPYDIDDHERPSRRSARRPP